MAHLKMVKMENFTLCVFYHSKKKKKKNDNGNSPKWMDLQIICTEFSLVFDGK